MFSFFQPHKIYTSFLGLSDSMDANAQRAPTSSLRMIYHRRYRVFDVVDRLSAAESCANRVQTAEIFSAGRLVAAAAAANGPHRLLYWERIS